MKRRYGMSPVSLSIRHTIKINEKRCGGGGVFELVMTKECIEENRGNIQYAIDVIRVFSHWLAVSIYLFLNESFNFKWGSLMARQIRQNAALSINGL